MYHVRLATPSDARLLARLAARLFEETFGAQNTAEDMRLYLATAFREEQILADLENQNWRTWIAEDEDNEAIGYAVLKRSTTPPVPTERAVEIWRLYADKHWHGRGVGAALMLACLEQARAWECDLVWLGVWDANARGIAFYEKNGFEIVGSQTFKLGNDLQNDLVMARHLD